MGGLGGLTLPGAKHVLQLLVVTGVHKVKDAVADQLQLRGGGQHGEGVLHTSHKHHHTSTLP